MLPYFYPFKFLCGAGVAFKLTQGLAERIGKRDMPLEYLDLAALASAADIVSLTDENRIIVSEGIKLINESPRHKPLVILLCKSN